MPTVLRVGAYRFYFYSNENAEPPHIHVQSGDSEAKYWLNPVDQAWNRGFNQRQLRQITDNIEDNLDLLLNAWKEFFGGTGDHDGR